MRICGPDRGAASKMTLKLLAVYTSFLPWRPTNTLRMGADMTCRRSIALAAVTAAALSLASCRDVVSPEPRAPALSAPRASLLDASAWTTVANLPFARTAAAAATLSDGRIIITGGISSNFSRTNVDAYDPASNTWSALAPLPAQRHFHAAVRAGNGRVYVFGG